MKGSIGLMNIILKELDGFLKTSTFKSKRLETIVSEQGTTDTVAIVYFHQDTSTILLGYLFLIQNKLSI